MAGRLRALGKNDGHLIYFDAAFVASECEWEMRVE